MKLLIYNITCQKNVRLRKHSATKHKNTILLFKLIYTLIKGDFAKYVISCLVSSLEEIITLDPPDRFEAKLNFNQLDSCP